MAKKINRERHRRRRADAKKAFVALMKVYPLTLDNLDGEIWRDIAGYDGDYQVSTFGRIKSFKKGRVKILKPNLFGEYICVELHKNCKTKTFLIHRLVPEVFIPNPDVKPFINHIDGHKFDNFVGNLEWITNAENMRHAFETGLAKSGEEHYRAKLTVKQVLYIRENPDGLTLVQLAEKLNVNETQISAIQLGKTYKNAGGTIRESKNRRIPKEERDQIRAEYATGNYTMAQLAEKHHCSLSTILTILHELDG